MLAALWGWLSVLVLSPFNAWGRGLLEEALNRDSTVRRWTNGVSVTHFCVVPSGLSFEHGRLRAELTAESAVVLETELVLWRGADGVPLVWLPARFGLGANSATYGPCEAAVDANCAVALDGREMPALGDAVERLVAHTLAEKKGDPWSQSL